MEDLLEAWRTNNRINLYPIDRISDAGLGCTLSARGGRGAAGQFAHMHNNRVWQLEKRAVDLTAHLDTFGSREEEGAVSGRARPRAWSLGLEPALSVEARPTAGPARFTRISITAGAQGIQLLSRVLVAGVQVQGLLVVADRAVPVSEVHAGFGQAVPRVP